MLLLASWLNFPRVWFTSSRVTAMGWMYQDVYEESATLKIVCKLGDWDIGEDEASSILSDVMAILDRRGCPIVALKVSVDAEAILVVYLGDDLLEFPWHLHGASFARLSAAFELEDVQSVLARVRETAACLQAFGCSGCYLANNIVNAPVLLRFENGERVG